MSHPTLDTNRPKTQTHTYTHTPHTHALSTLGHTEACTFDSTSCSCRRLPGMNLPTWDRTWRSSDYVAQKQEQPSNQTTSVFVVLIPSSKHKHRPLWCQMLRTRHGKIRWPSMSGHRIFPYCFLHGRRFKKSNFQKPLKNANAGETGAQRA